VPSTQDEAVDVVDESDRVIGSATIGECLSKSLLHRAVAVLVVRSNGSVLLQQRGLKDSWQPGMWTLSCTGHVRKSESYAGAGNRELWEELGLRARILAKSKHRIPPIKEGDLVENEWVQLFVAPTESKVSIDPVEVEAVREVGPSELQTLVSRGPLTPDAKILLRSYASSGPSHRSCF
jgi:isopentenyldiphosphate isomerase